MFKLPDRGGVVVLDATGAGATAGFQRGDLILEVNGHPPKTPNGFWEAVHAAPRDQPIRLRYWRDGKEQETQVAPRGRGTPQPPVVPA